MQKVSEHRMLNHDIGHMGICKVDVRDEKQKTESGQVGGTL